MKAVIISDKDQMTPLYRQLHDELAACLADYEIEEFSVGREELAYCSGCFGCWVKTPGQCVMRDGIADINRACVGSDAVFYLSPVVFGQFSANMKAALDRWLPNMLPFFIVRPDGSTMHPVRYRFNPAQVFIGYSDSVSAEDARLFEDIVNLHRHSAKAFVYDASKGLAPQLEPLSLKKSEGLL